MPAAPLYVETRIRAHPDRVWRYTRDPARHQRWDLRFTEISALAQDAGSRGAETRAGDTACRGRDGDRRTGGTAAANQDPVRAPDVNPDVHSGGIPDDPGADPEAAAQRFRYATRPLPGLTIAGHGTAIGERRRPDGTATSALRFASAHPLSPIRAGRGYWRYIPTDTGVRFLTGYDYTPGFGGRALDRAVRPLLGWATAWSFDRLRLWVETGAAPELLLRRALADAAVRLASGAAVAAVTRSPAATACAALACLLVPPRAGTPAARRCLRTAPDRTAATAPATLAELETP